MREEETWRSRARAAGFFKQLASAVFSRAQKKSHTLIYIKSEVRFLRVKRTPMHHRIFLYPQRFCLAACASEMEKEKEKHSCGKMAVSSCCFLPFLCSRSPAWKPETPLRPQGNIPGILSTVNILPRVAILDLGHANRGCQTAGVCENTSHVTKGGCRSKYFPVHRRQDTLGKASSASMNAWYKQTMPGTSALKQFLES